MTMRKLLVGFAASVGLAIVPALLGNPAALQHPQLWILIGVGLLASLTQPAYAPIDRDARRRKTARAAVLDPRGLRVGTRRNAMTVITAKQKGDSS
jgi:hypothetical protein